MGKKEFAAVWTPNGVVCDNAEDTVRLGAWLAGELEMGSVVSLEGPLGAGKTQLVKGMAAALGFAGTVTSPSFALVHEYVGGRWPVAHFDFYRMGDAGELETMGYDDCLASGVTVIEWGNKFPEALPPDVLRVRLEILSRGGRRVRAGRG